MYADSSLLYTMFKHWIHSWEINLSKRDRYRKASQFGWGMEYLCDMEEYLQSPPAADPADPHAFYTEFAEKASAASELFFQPQVRPEFHLHDNWLTFRSTVHTPHENNNTVYARYFPVPPKPGDTELPPVVIVLPQWNADSSSHVAVCKGLTKFGMASVRLSLPYHGCRRPADQIRADFMVSPNIGRTIQSCRQAVHDVRCVLDWLEQQGYKRFGIIGTSIGSCIGFLAYVHDPRIKVGAFNHVSSYFSDVVWTGISTSHVRAGLEGHISRDELRRYWLPISPQPFVQRLRQEEHKNHKTLLISARYDLTFLPHLSRQLMGEFERHRIPHRVSWLPCGHYTTGETPFKFYDGFLMINHVRKYL